MSKKSNKSSSLFFSLLLVGFFAVVFHLSTFITYAAQPVLGSWTFVGLSGYTILSVTVDPNNSSVVYVGTGGNGILKSTDGGTTWNPINSGIPSPATITDIVVDPTNSSALYAGGAGFAVPGIFKSTDAGATWVFANIGVGGPLNVSNMVMDPNNPNNLYAAIGVNCGSVYKSIDGAATWVRGIGLTCDPSVVMIDPLNSSVLYARSPQGVNKSVDSGVTWSVISGFGASSGFYGLAIDRLDPTKLYADTDTGVYASTDSGVNWVLSDSGLTNVYRGLIADPVRANTVYAGEDRGVETSAFMTTNSGSTWTDITGGLPNVGVKRLLVPATDSNTMYAGTDSGLYVYGLGPIVTPTPTNTPTPTPTSTPVPTVTPTPSQNHPTNKDQCKNNGWKSFTNPSFKNQGDCVSFVVSHK